MFLNEGKKIESVKDIFTGLYGLDFDELGDKAVQMALDEPDRYKFVVNLVFVLIYINVL